MMSTTLSIFLIIVLFLLALFVIPAYMTRRAVFEVIRRFCRHGAVRRRDAVTQEDLGLNPPTFVERIGKPRDYKPYAVRFLKEAEVIRETEDGRLYMDQQKLEREFRCREEDHL